jgi:hypothetical protein
MTLATDSDDIIADPLYNAELSSNDAAPSTVGRTELSALVDHLEVIEQATTAMRRVIERVAGL